MNRYTTFLVLFILAAVTMLIFLVFYLQAFFDLAMQVDAFDRHQNPVELLRTILSPQVIISGAAMFFTSLVYRIAGIVQVARSKAVTDGEKALWIVGFVLMGFITGIVYLVMAKGRKIVT